MPITHQDENLRTSFWSQETSALKVKGRGVSQSIWSLKNYLELIILTFVTGKETSGEKNINNGIFYVKKGGKGWVKP